MGAAVGTGLLVGAAVGAGLLAKAAVWAGLLIEAGVTRIANSSIGSSSSYSTSSFNWLGAISLTAFTNGISSKKLGVGLGLAAKGN